MQGQRFTKNKGYLTKEKKLEKVHYKLFVFGLISYVIYYGFLSPKIIGHSSNYFYLVFLSPVLFGLIFLSIYRRKSISHRWFSCKTIFDKIFIVAFTTIQGVIISYTSFGLVAMIIFDFLNKSVAEQNSIETKVYQIDRFWTKRGSEVNFYINGHWETIKVPYSKIKDYANKNPEDYNIVLKAQKGLWGYYLLKEWYIEQNQNKINID